MNRIWVGSNIAIVLYILVNDNYSSPLNNISLFETENLMA